MLVAVGTDGYTFRHALLAEAVYDDLLPGERVRLHAAYAKALAAREAVGTAAELARHARAAHDLATATRASVEAGDEAMAVGGPEEADAHYELALELLADPDVAEALAGRNQDCAALDQVDLVLRASPRTRRRSPLPSGGSCPGPVVGAPGRCRRSGPRASCCYALPTWRPVADTKDDWWP